MSLQEIQTRRLRLMQALAEVVGYQVEQGGSGWFPLSSIRNQPWVRETYNFQRMDDSDSRPLLFQDLEEIERRGWIKWDSTTVEGHLEQSPDKWNIGLNEAGVKAVEEYEAELQEARRNFLVRAYHKQPMTAFQILAALLLGLTTGLLGWYTAREATKSALRKELEPLVRQELVDSLTPKIREELTKQLRLEREVASKDAEANAQTQKVITPATVAAPSVSPTSPSSAPNTIVSSVPATTKASVAPATTNAPSAPATTAPTTKPSTLPAH